MWCALNFYKYCICHGKIPLLNAIFVGDNSRFKNIKMKPSSHNNSCRTIVLAIVSQRVLLDKFTQLTQQSCMLQLAETVKVLQVFM